jgi:hypothetical protein
MGEAVIQRKLRTYLLINVAASLMPENEVHAHLSM